MTTSPTTSERIRNAEETISKAQSALDTAQKGLHSAEEVVNAAEKVKANPWAKAGITAVFLMMVLAIVMKVRNKEADLTDSGLTRS